MRRYGGSCHCGRYSLTFSSSTVPDEFIPRADSCGFCVRHNQAAISDPKGNLTLVVPPDAQPPYRFGLNITDFHICDRCGVFMAATWQDESDVYGVVNYRVLDDLAAFSKTPVVVDFEGEDVAARQHRRRIGWTPTTIEKRV